jgi:uncharacterized cupredoxin-like copper-binding protein
VVALALALTLISASFFGLAAVREAAAQSDHPGTLTTIDVTATTSYSFTPNTFEQVATNSTVSVSFTDASSVSHTFTIIGREGWVIPSSYTDSQISALAYGGTYPNLVNVNVSAPGTVPGSFHSPGPGWYEFLCTESGHFTLGMYGFIAFGMNLPSNLTVASASEGPGAALFIIIGTIVALVVVTLVLGFVVGKRRGSEMEMPPERLGYAEPPTTEPQPLPPEQGRHP